MKGQQSFSGFNKFKFNNKKNNKDIAVKVAALAQAQNKCPNEKLRTINEKLRTIIKNDEFDPSQISFKKMPKGKMIYPTYAIDNSQHAILIQTPYITLRRSPFFSKDLDGSFKLYKDAGNSDPSSQEMNQIFDTFAKLDNYTNDNINNIMSVDDNIKPKMKYLECVKQSKNFGPYLKFKMNFRVEQADENTDNNQLGGSVLSQNVINESLVAQVFYKTNYAEPKHKLHTLKDLQWIIKPGKRIRFILAINKLWYNYDNYGYGIKIVQMEIDNNLTNRFKSLQGNSSESMFDKYLQEKRDKYSEYLMRNLKCGMNKYQKERENTKILNIVDKTADKYLMNDEETDGYVPIIEI